ncbi:hypothetical protein ACLI09_01880 [Flavobacterium sp. RHBU_24]|uniref:hypothetical protein n=1 Tax=Flavobacterium sp. RHBU_24 TaxID=3391185 RepID=UPI0039856376
MGRRSLTLTFALFMALSFSCCVYLIISGSIALGNRYVLRPERIVSIRAPDPAPSRSVVYDTLLAQQLLNFRNYVTALQSSESGRRQLDSLLTARPGLLDSVSMAESLIINQKNTDHGKGQ